MRLIDTLIEPQADARPLHLVSEEGLPAWIAGLDLVSAALARDAGFRGAAGQTVVLAGGAVAAGYDPQAPRWALGMAPNVLPAGAYRLSGDAPPALSARAAASWALGAYRDDRHRTHTATPPARLCWPAGVDRDDVRTEVEAILLVRDLVNAPANHMGPAELEAAARDLAARHGARVESAVGDELLAAGYPLVHAVGRASARPPRLMSLTWGDPLRPRLTVVGKGVCFDSGGLGVKPSETMLLMKKDMGGAAHALGLAHLVMSADLPVRLRVLIPAVENAIGGDAMRPLDVVRSRAGLTVEIGHTDAEGRLILADALAAACEDGPDLLVDFATLTSAARFALGPEIPALFTEDEDLAALFAEASRAFEDPLWRLPFWREYGAQMTARSADVLSVMPHNHGGAIYAAEFLRRFVLPETAWAHVDLFAWNVRERPGRPAGGEAQTLLAAFDVVRRRLCRSETQA